MSLLQRARETVAGLRDWLPDEYPTSTIVRRELSARLVRPFTSIEEPGVDVMAEDWDNLIILDACRYDTFQDLSALEGDLSREISPASHTTEFLEAVLTEEHPDTVCVTASPQLAGWEDIFHHIEHVWEDGWDDEHNTVIPSTIDERAREAAERFPDKRLIVHYMQPHFPFIGPTGREIEQGSFNAEFENRENASVWELLYGNDLDVETARTAYRENLEIVLEHVDELLPDLDGKTVVTSDHGNLFGKQVSALPITIYGHPPGIEDRELRSVPWLEVPHDGRKDITAGDTTGSGTREDRDEVIEDRLRDLGYI